MDYLQQQEIAPAMIDICRSRISGFTPADQWHFIENRLMAELGIAFELQVAAIQDVVKLSTTVQSAS